MSRSVATVILYALNERRFVSDAVASLLGQTYSPLEIVLSDDGSSDGTFEIMQEMAAAYRGPHRVFLNRNERPIGIGSQLNAAIGMTAGELVVLANADDVSLPHRVARTVEEWERSGRRAAAITANLECIDTEGNPIGRVIRTAVSFAGLEDGVSRRFGPVAAASLALRRDVFERFPPLMANLILEDGPLAMRAALLGPLVHIDECLVRYRIHRENISQAYAVERYGPWLERHRARLLWQRREGVKAYLQMLVDLHSSWAEGSGLDSGELERARWMAMERLLEYHIEAAFVARDGSVPDGKRLAALWRLAARVVRNRIKCVVPALQRRANRWHYRQARRAAGKTD